MSIRGIVAIDVVLTTVNQKVNNGMCKLALLWMLGDWVPGNLVPSLFVRTSVGNGPGVPFA